MSKTSRLYKLFILMILVLLALAGCRSESQKAETQLFIPQPAIQGNFQKANPDTKLVFPADHAAHDDYQTEWWYYTGNLSTAEGRDFGYQLTFFRRALQAEDQRQPRTSQWAAEQVYLAHFALTDVQDENFYYFDRLGRGAAGLAGATADPEFEVWLEDWTVEQSGTGQYRLAAAEGEVSLDLMLQDSKGPVLQGLNGYSQKGPGEGNASMYYSLSRLVSSGTVTIGESQYQVSGNNWMDHEFSTSALSGEQVGWDWFALQLDNGYELMVYTIRDSAGKTDPYSRGTWIDPQGGSAALLTEGFAITVTDTWTSPHSGAVYPAGWTIAVPGEGINLQVTPLIPDQELNLSFIYWEGAVELSGVVSGEKVTGKGYVELTGYAQSMQGQF